MTIPVWTWRDAVRKAKVPTLTKALCWALSTYMNEIGRGAWPSLETLSEDTGMSVRSISNHLKIADQAGLLHARRRRRKDGTLGSYTFHPRFPKGMEVLHEIPAIVGGVEVPDDDPPARDADGVQPPACDDPTTGTTCRAMNLPTSELSNRNPLPPSGASPKGGRASRLPSNFVVPDVWREWAADEAPKFVAMIDHEAAKFVDHWHGNGGRKIDWAATWRNWWRRSVERAPRQFNLLPTSRDRYIDECRKSREIAAQVCAEFERGKSL